MTGPLLRPPAQLQSGITGDLKVFLEEALANDEPVFYITLGSEVIW